MFLSSRHLRDCTQDIFDNFKLLNYCKRLADLIRIRSSLSSCINNAPLIYKKSAMDGVLHIRGRGPSNPAVRNDKSRAKIILSVRKIKQFQFPQSQDV